MNPEKLLLNQQLFALVMFVNLSACTTAPGTLEEMVAGLEANQFSGVVLVTKNDEILFESGFGSASCDQRTNNTANTIFAIGSITKLFTDVAIYRLESDGLLDTGLPIASYLDGVPADKQSITIEQLMQHRSGIDTYHETEAGMGDFEVMDKNRAKAEIFSRPLLFSPGRREEYSNSGYTLLAMIIEEVSGQSYADYLRSKLFLPAGMERTGFWGERFSEMASTENEILGCSSPADWNYSWVLVGNGGMVSTIGDLRRWMHALRAGNVLDRETLERSGIARSLAGGFGTAGGSSQHEFNAAVEYDGRDDVLVVAISNKNTVRAESIAMNFLRAAAAAPGT